MFDRMVIYKKAVGENEHDEYVMTEKAFHELMFRIDGDGAGCDVIIVPTDDIFRKKIQSLSENPDWKLLDLDEVVRKILIVTGKTDALATALLEMTKKVFGIK